MCAVSNQCRTAFHSKVPRSEGPKSADYVESQRNGLWKGTTLEKSPDRLSTAGSPTWLAALCRRLHAANHVAGSEWHATVDPADSIKTG
jgi:hypothetical protein